MQSMKPHTSTPSIGEANPRMGEQIHEWLGKNNFFFLNLKYDKEVEKLDSMHSLGLQIYSSSI